MKASITTQRKAVSAIDVTIGLVVVAALAAGVLLAVRSDRGGDRPESPETATEEAAVAKIDPALVKYRAAGTIDVPLDEVRALAVGPSDQIYVGGDQAIVVFDAEGNLQRTIEVQHEPRCLAVAANGDDADETIFSAAADRVVRIAPDGSVAGEWPSLGRQAAITSIAVRESDVFVADAGNKIVLHYDTSGKLLGRIGAADPERNVPGFAITSPHFDLALSPDGLLRVVNPRMLRIEAYTFDGDLEFHFGKGGTGLENFFGCCNPTHFAVLPDGRFVTAEKGVARVKVYSPEGKLDCVVAGPDTLQIRNAHAIADLAVDRSGRVLALDLSERRIRLFEPDAAASEEN